MLNSTENSTTFVTKLRIKSFVCSPYDENKFNGCGLLVQA